MKPRLFILAAVVLWSTGGAAIKLCGLSGWQVACGRSWVAAAALLALLPSSRRRPDRRGWGVAVAYAATVLLFVLATKLTTAANAIFLQYTAPLYVLLMGTWLLGERPSRGAKVTFPLFVVGLLLFFVDDLAPGQGAGNLLALGSGLSFAVMIVGLRQSGGGNSHPAILWGNLLAAVVALPMALQGRAPSAVDLGLLLYLGLFQLGLAYVLFARGIEGTPALESSLLGFVEPVLNPLWTLLFTGERPGPWAVLGGAVILGGAAWLTLSPVLLRRRAEPAVETALPR